MKAFFFSHARNSIKSTIEARNALHAGRKKIVEREKKVYVKY